MPVKKKERKEENLIIRVPKTFKRLCEKQAKAERRSLSGFVRCVLEDAMANR